MQIGNGAGFPSGTANAIWVSGLGPGFSISISQAGNYRSAEVHLFGAFPHRSRLSAQPSASSAPPGILETESRVPFGGEEAVRLQRSARGKGLPRDLYVQNYSE
jgi:hypothetical protein